MAEPSSAVCDCALAADGRAPDWVHLFPAGRMTGRDGRVFVLLDAEAVIRDFRARGIDLPVDFEHQNDRPEAKLHGPVPAAGWIKELRADDTGLWGRIEWTATAREMIGQREYRYLSPSFTFHPENRAILRLKGAGLVHNPNLELTALASEEPDMPAPDETDRNQPAQSEAAARIAALLGLPPDSDPQDILRAVMVAVGLLPSRQVQEKAMAAERPDPARFVPVDAVQELMTTHNERVATMREAEASAKVATALREGHITPGLRDWATALCMQNPESFDAFLSRSAAPYARLLRPVEFGPLDSAAASPSSTPAAAAICAQLGLAPDALKD